jgi:hypothetical protein
LEGDRYKDISEPSTEWEIEPGYNLEEVQWNRGDATIYFGEVIQKSQYKKYRFLQI